MSELMGIESAPVAKHEHDGAEFPKWVEPHDSHVVRTEHGVSVYDFDFHVDRDGKVTVLVNNAEHEAKASAPREEKKPEQESHEGSKDSE